MKRMLLAVEQGYLNAIKATVCCIGLTLAFLIVTFSVTPQAFAKPAPQSGQKFSKADADQPVELGDVQWLRDLDTAVSNSSKTNKPIAILFQEVPG